MTADRSAADGDRGAGPVRSAALGAFAAAALFGASTPLGKRLLVDVAPAMLAALLYAGAGIAALPWALGAWRRGEAPPSRRDLPLLAGVIGLGGVAAPLLLLYGLSRTSATLAALLQNLEAVFTAAIAVVVFGEWIGRRGVGALVLMVVGCALSTWAAGGATHALTAPLAVAFATLAWAIDNNLTQRLSLRDPYAIVCIKGLGAAPIALAIARGLDAPWPRGAAVAGALGVGALAYGVSLLLYVRATRTLGAARTGMWFATAPFVGAVLAVPICGEAPSLRLGAAALVVGAGALLLVTERHDHVHTHERVEHEHVHVHDEHHQHAHPGEAGQTPHSHVHRHEPITHAHPHASDAHHRHRH